VDLDCDSKLSIEQLPVVTGTWVCMNFMNSVGLNRSIFIRNDAKDAVIYDLDPRISTLFNSLFRGIALVGIVLVLSGLGVLYNVTLAVYKTGSAAVDLIIQSNTAEAKIKGIEAMHHSLRVICDLAVFLLSTTGVLSFVYGVLIPPNLKVKVLNKPT
jgi:hypothetical protein